MAYPDLSPSKFLENEERLRTLLEWFKEFEEVTADARKLSERDRDFRDGIQWTEEEEQDLKDRGQPVITNNRIAPKFNYVIGSEIQNRVDPKAYPRTPAHEDTAPVITDAIRYVCDNNDFNEQDAEVMEDVGLDGYGGYVIYPEGEGENRDIKITAIPWDRIWFDPFSRKANFKDARYKGTVLWWDFEEAKKEYPGGEAAMALNDAKNNAANAPDAKTFDDKPRWFHTERNRVQIFECYWREGKDWYSAHFCWGGFVRAPKKLEFKTDKGKPYCPMELTTAFIARNHNNMRYGLVRNMISPQEALNKRESKALHLLSMRQVAFETDAVDDVQEAQTQLAMPDGAVEVGPGALSEGRFQILPTNDMAQGQMQLLQESKANIDQTGPDAALVASDQRQMSGRLFLARQQAGQMELGRVFDNIRALKIAVYKIVWYQIRQFWPFEKWLRVRDSEERGGFRFVGLNQRMTRMERFQQLMQQQVPLEVALDSVGLPKPVSVRIFLVASQQADQVLQQQAQMQAIVAQQNGQPPPPPAPPEAMQQLLLQIIGQEPEMQETFVANDVAQIDVDIEIDVVPDTTIVQQEQFADLMKLVQTGQIQIPPDILIEMSDIRDKKQILNRMNQPDPAAEAAQQAAMEAQQAQIQKLQAEVALLSAKAQKEAAETQISIPAEAKKDEAQAMKAAADAGAQQAPDVGQGE